MLAITVYCPTAVSRSRMCANIARQVIGRACSAVRCPKEAQVSVVFVGDKKMRELNRKYRGKDKTANVLAFNAGQQNNRITGQHAVDLGDIFISLPEAKREAKKYEWTLKYGIARLALHGFLHLLGYDHARAKDAKHMEHIEGKLLRLLYR